MSIKKVRANSFVLQTIQLVEESTSNPLCEEISLEWVLPSTAYHISLASQVVIWLNGTAVSKAEEQQDDCDPECH